MVITYEKMLSDIRIFGLIGMLVKKHYCGFIQIVTETKIMKTVLNICVFYLTIYSNHSIFWEDFSEILILNV